MNVASLGKIITFYSYKGGSSRSMALANIAWILASNGKRVLVIDWDLEAPGLHRYFAPFIKDKEIVKTKGIIDFLWDYIDSIPDKYKNESFVELFFRNPSFEFSDYVSTIKWDFSESGRIDFIPAGRQSPSYAKKVNQFNWNHFYECFNGGEFIEYFRTFAKQDYDFILIDSRTGVGDSSGICTVQWPDILLIFYTPNNQSILGAAAIAESIEKQWETQSKSNFEKLIFPILTRTERAEFDKLDAARNFARSKFEKFIKPNQLKSVNNYWLNCEIPYFTWYAFEEVLATFRDTPKQRDSLLAAYEEITKVITNNKVTSLVPPNETERKIVLSQFERYSQNKNLIETQLNSKFSVDFLILSSLPQVIQNLENSLENLTTVFVDDFSYVPCVIGEIRIKGSSKTSKVAVLMLPIEGKFESFNLLLRVISICRPKLNITIGLANSFYNEQLSSNLESGDVVISENLLFINSKNDREFEKCDFFSSNIEIKKRISAFLSKYMKSVYLSKNDGNDTISIKPKIQFGDIIFSEHKYLNDPISTMNILNFAPSALAIDMEGDGVEKLLYEDLVQTKLISIKGIYGDTKREKIRYRGTKALINASEISLELIKSGVLLDI